jgi:hypothetical protein
MLCSIFPKHTSLEGMLIDLVAETLRAILQYILQILKSEWLDF